MVTRPQESAVSSPGRTLSVVCDAYLSLQLMWKDFIFPQKTDGMMPANPPRIPVIADSYSVH